MTKLTKESFSGREELGERRDCVVRAFSIAADLPYTEVHALFKRLGRKNRQATYTETSLEAAKILGLKKKSFGRVTSKKFLEDVKNVPRLVAYMRGHAFAVTYGEVADIYPECVKPRTVIRFYLVKESA